MTQKTPAPKPKGTVFKSAAAPAFTPDRVASAFIEEGKRRNISVIGIQEAICAGLDESNLRVLANPVNPASQALPNDGIGTDHDSDGPLQQRGSQGWGTLDCRMDPHAAPVCSMTGWSTSTTRILLRTKQVGGSNRCSVRSTRPATTTRPMAYCRSDLQPAARVTGTGDPARVGRPRDLNLQGAHRR
jgi:hypothetical protein